MTHQGRCVRSSGPRRPVAQSTTDDEEDFPLTDDDRQDLVSDELSFSALEASRPVEDQVVSDRNVFDDSVQDATDDGVTEFEQLEAEVHRQNFDVEEEVTPIHERRKRNERETADNGGKPTHAVPRRGIRDYIRNIFIFTDRISREDRPKAICRIRPSVRLTVRLFPLDLFTRLTVEHEFLYV